MEKKVLFSVVAISMVIILASFLVPVSKQAHDQFLPWQIEPTADGSIKVFGLILDKSTLDDAEKLFQGGAKVSMFSEQGGQYKVEAYFDKVVLGGFSAKLVMVMALSQEQMAAMFGRGTRIGNLGGGKKKVTLAADDLKTVFSSPIRSLAYLTRARLDEEMLSKRFGEPEQRLQEPESGTTHWLYPALGVDVALSNEGYAVLQYISPQRFSDLMAPLQKLNGAAMAPTQ